MSNKPGLPGMRERACLRGAAPPRARALLLGGLMLMTSCSSSQALPLDDLWKDASARCDYVTPAAEELHRAEDAFRRTLQRKEDLPALQSAWQALEFELVPARVDPAEFLVLREQPEHRRGRGFYLFYLGQAPEIALEAPHSAFDEHTGEIALHLMKEGLAAAAAWSTAARQQADLAHLPETYFQSFTAAVARTSPKGVILQLHGFEQTKRKSEAAAAADMIVSSGIDFPPDWVRALANGFKRNMPGNVKLYPDDVHDLGGTANAQGQMLRDLGYEGFAHVEMSKGLRLRLSGDPAVRKSFADSAAAALTDGHR